LYRFNTWLIGIRSCAEENTVSANEYKILEHPVPHSASLRDQENLKFAECLFFITENAGDSIAVHSQNYVIKLMAFAFNCLAKGSARCGSQLANTRTLCVVCL
jgi:hypothetical protein